MKLRNRMMFWEGDDGGGFGGGGDSGGGEAAAPQEGSRGTAVFEEGEGAGAQREGQQRPQEAEKRGPAGPPQVNAKELAVAFGDVIGQHFRPPQKEISVEEAKKLLNVWEPTPEWQARYDNLETRAQAIVEQRDGLIRQADTIMRYRMGEMQRAMEERYAPVVQYMQQQEARAGEYRFVQNYPQLGNPGLRPLLFSVAQSLLANGARFRDEGEMFNALAKGVESVIKVNNPGFSLEAAGKQSNGQPVGETRAKPGGLPVTTPGSSGGVGNATKPPAKPRGLAVFD